MTAFCTGRAIGFRCAFAIPHDEATGEILQTHTLFAVWDVTPSVLMRRATRTAATAFDETLQLCFAHTRGIPADVTTISVHVADTLAAKRAVAASCEVRGATLASLLRAGTHRATVGILCRDLRTAAVPLNVATK